MLRTNDYFFHGFTLWNANNITASSFVQNSSYLAMKPPVRDALLNARINLDYDLRADFVHE